MPDPDFELSFADGKKVSVHAKGVQLAEFGDLMVAHMQLLPLSVFGRSYDQGDGRQLAHGIEQVLLRELRASLIFVGDC